MTKGPLAAIVFVVAAAIAAGFYYIGPPADARARRFDDRRQDDLQRLRLAADLFWTRNGQLPPTLEALSKEAGTSIYSGDPETGAAYPYAVKSADVYELCAVFARPSETPGDFWSHPAGRHCYTITARHIKP